MTKQKAIIIAGTHFPNYPNAEAFTITSDGQAFHEAHHATNHGNSFKKKEDQEVFTITRAEWMEATAGEGEANTEGEAGAEGEKVKPVKPAKQKPAKIKDNTPAPQVPTAEGGEAPKADAQPPASESGEANPE